MLKRRRLHYTNDETGEREDLMEVESSQNNYSADSIISSNGCNIPEAVKLAYEIAVLKPVEFVEPSGRSLGVSLYDDHSKLIDGQELVELTRDVAQADERVKSKVKFKLEMIAEQMAYLREQAMDVLKEAQENVKLNHIPCNIRKVPGSIYHLYQKPSGQQYFSILSPKEWNNLPPHTYCGTYKYDQDSSWKKISELTIC